MAEGLFREMTKNDPEFKIGSAGVGAIPGQAASQHSVTALKKMGIDISKHRSQPLTQGLANKADMIFVMTKSHLETIRYLFPEAEEKTFLIREFEQSGLRPVREVPDPIGMNLDAYLDCRDTIRKALPGILSFIRQSEPPTSMISTTEEPAAETKSLRISLGSDHGGIELKQKIDAFLKGNGQKIADLGTFTNQSVDYPDFAQAVCEQVVAGEADYGILVCTSGIGMSIAANRYPQIRAALVATPENAALSRRHNNANVLCLAGAQLDEATTQKIVETFLNTAFEGGRHERRVEKLGHLGGADAPKSLSEVDPQVFAAIKEEEKRQFENIELIASENFTSRAVMEAQGSCLTNKYAEGYPGRRWYGGCENADTVEQLAIDRAKQLFGAEFVNVQPHSGSQANMAVYFSVLQPGDKILTMDLAHGGHLTHGHKANFSGRFFTVSHYGVSQANEQIDYDALAKQAAEFQPKMITAGASAYPRIIDFKKMREIADSVGAMLFVDMAHIAGLVAGGQHPTPVPYADFVTTTTHKSLRGPRGGLIMAKEKYGKGIDGQTFPGIQGGPLMHVIAAKAVCLHEALQPGFKTYTAQIVKNAKALADSLGSFGWRIVSGGTDNHLMLVDLRPNGLDGKTAQETLDRAGITINKNGIPFDTMPISKGGGIRVGTPAVTTRGMKEAEMLQIADLMNEALRNVGNEQALEKVRHRVIELTVKFPLPY